MCRISIALALGLAIGLAGCEANPKMVDQEGRVFFESGTDVGHHVSVVRQESDRVEGNLLRVRTDLKNRVKEDVWIDVQIVWKDAKGFKLYETNWAPLMIPARFTKTHEVVCMQPAAADYEFRVRKPRKTTRP